MTQAYTNHFYEVHELTGAFVDTLQVGVHQSLNYRNLANHQRIVGILVIDELAQGATVDLALLQATDAAGTGAKALKAITQLSQANGDGGDSVIIEVRTEELDVDGGFCWVGGTITIGGAAVNLALVGLLGGSNYVPVPVTNWTEVVV